jgi:transcription elongation factor GreB
MSKAFTSEETPDDPVVVRARAPLPPGVPNYVTSRGLGLLREEMEALERERDLLAAEVAAGGAPGDAPDADRRARLGALAPRLTELAQRIGSAVVQEAPPQPPDEVRFGAEVEVRGDDGQVRRYHIVGVDEANARQGRVAFVSPLARALLGRRVGEGVAVPTPRGEEQIEVVRISY